MPQAGKAGLISVEFRIFVSICVGVFLPWLLRGRDWGSLLEEVGVLEMRKAGSLVYRA